MYDARWEAMENIVFENEDFIVAFKPSGLIAEEDSKGNENLRMKIHQYIKETYPWKKQLICELVNRIDRPVSGLLLCAKKKSILQNLQRQFYLRTVKKFYLAIVDGTMTQQQGILENYIIKNTQLFRAVSATQEEPEAKRAILTFTVIAIKDNMSLLKVQITTGRFHQIRFQFSHIGFPIWNDAWYGAKKVNKDVRIGLHSYRLEFNHPKTDERLVFTKVPEFSEPWNLFETEINQILTNEGYSKQD